MKLNYKKLQEACKMYTHHLQDYPGEYTEEETQSHITSMFNRALEGVMFPELGKLDTQQKVDAAAVFMVKLCQSDTTSMKDTIKNLFERNGHPELVHYATVGITFTAILSEWLKIYPEELGEEFPNTYKYYKEHEDSINYSENHIIAQTIAGEKGTDSSKYVDGVRNMIVSLLEMYDIFKEETDYTDDECENTDWMLEMLNDCVSK